MSSNHTILLVEDNPDDVFIFKRTVKAARITYQMKVLSNGQEAVEYLSPTGKFADREEHPLPFLIFLDLKMPFLDGFEVLSWIGSQAPLNGIPAVVLTSSAEERDRRKAAELGAKGYFVKPPKPETLKEMLQFVHEPNH